MHYSLKIGEMDMLSYLIRPDTAIRHQGGEYPRGDVHTNTAESSFSLLKRGVTGIFHAVSKEHLHRYVGEFDFRWSTRAINDGQPVAQAIQSATGKRLMYNKPASKIVLREAA